MSDGEIRSPGVHHRTVVLGATGSGKTVFSAHLLSGQNFHRQPWIIGDVKMDELILKIVDDNKIQEIDPTSKPPNKPGLYHLPYMPKDIDEVDAFLWKVDERARQGKGTGIYLDEGYSINQNNKAPIATILTQGRTLKMPVIACFQRPTWMNQHFIAQANFFSVFPLTKLEDKKKAAETISPAKLPDGTQLTPFSDLPKWHSLWHDVGRRQTMVLRPAPSEDDILNAFRARLGRSNRTYI